MMLQIIKFRASVCASKSVFCNYCCTSCISIWDKSCQIRGK